MIYSPHNAFVAAVTTVRRFFEDFALHIHSHRSSESGNWSQHVQIEYWPREGRTVTRILAVSWHQFTPPCSVRTDVFLSFSASDLAGTLNNAITRSAMSGFGEHQNASERQGVAWVIQQVMARFPGYDADFWMEKLFVTGDGDPAPDVAQL